MRKILPHDSVSTHVTGQSKYIDDRTPLQGEVFVEVFYSSEAHAEILKLDFSEALALAGVIAIYTTKDFHSNLWGTIIKDQPLLAEKTVNFVGEGIALIAAESREIARDARNLIRAVYRPLPALLSIEAARNAKSWIGASRTIERGDTLSAMASAPHVIEGKTVIRGADHFYLESQAAVAYPLELGAVEVHSSAQHSTEVQHVVSHALGLSSKDVVCIVKRMGGAFGGKESQAAPFAAYAALVATRLQRPARVILTKDDDMVMTGKRNPFEIFYKVGFDGEGRILALDAQLFSDGGAYADLSTSIMERAMLHIDSAYFIENLRVTGQVCRTHFHPHTAFRGFGGPKGMAALERVIEEIAQTLSVAQGRYRDTLDIRKLNLYSKKGPRSFTHYDQKFENNVLPELIEQLEIDSDYRKRRQAILKQNKKRHHHRLLRGLSLTPVKFGISFTTRFLNQANALVVVHRDGSLQVSTGATEMGQGVNARIGEIVASELGIERSDVRIMATSTEKNANTSPTAASSGTDLNGAAALLATRKIKARLSELALSLFDLPESRWARHTAGLGTEPEIEVSDEQVNTQDSNADADWPTGIATYHGVTFQDGFVFLEKTPEKRIRFSALVNEAYHHRISLSEYAHYRFPGLSFNKLTGKGNAFLYFTQGAAVSEVSIDRLTGEVKVLRVDILMDLGRPVNEALDLGQITGGFIQGMGWMTTEKLFYSAGGALLAHAPSTYKIPNIQDTPREFNVKLFRNDENRVNVRGTKAAGEPPLLLSISVWTAIHDALSGVSKNTGEFPHLEIPATQEEILRALEPDAFARWSTQ